MADLMLEGNGITVKFKDGTKIKTGIIVAKNDDMSAKVLDAISAAGDKASAKYDSEIGELYGKVEQEANRIKGQLTAVPKTGGQKTILKTIIAPSPKVLPTDTTARTDTTSIDVVPVKTDWINEIKNRLADAAGGDLAPIEYLFENRAEIKKHLNPETVKEHQKVATREIFAALSNIPSFEFNRQTQNDSYKLLRTQVFEKGSLEGASQNVINEANAYIRHFLINLRPLNNTAGYDKEIRQIPRCREIMDGKAGLSDPMNSETVVAAALFIRRWNLEQKQVPESSIPVWQTQKAEAPKKMMAPMAGDTLPPLNREKLEIRF